MSDRAVSNQLLCPTRRRRERIAARTYAGLDATAEGPVRGPEEACEIGVTRRRL